MSAPQNARGAYTLTGRSPVLGVTGGFSITSVFGYRTDPVKGTPNTMHKGIDVLGPNWGQTNIPITAMGKGTVKKCFKNCPGTDTVKHTAGNYVWIDHGNGLVSKYMHMKYGSIPNTIDVGVAVDGNTILGIMGTTGYSTGVHLHFQVEKDGTPIEPYPYVATDLTGSNLLDPSAVQSYISSYSTNLGFATVVQDPEEGSGYQPSTDDILSTTNAAIQDSDFVKIKHIAGVFGLPYQFLPATDPRLDGSTETENIGYEYGEKIVERIPLLFLAPGRASFMTKYSKKNKQNVLEKLITLGAADSSSSSLDDLLDTDGKYYTFEYDPTTYYKFVNPMCRIAARYLNLQDVTINGTKLDKFNWETFTKSGIKSIGDFGTYTSIPFYVDTDMSVSESFSNSTTQSQLAGTINSISDMSKELNFLLGYGAGGTNIGEAISYDSSIAESVTNVGNMVSQLLGSGGFFSNLGSHLVTVAEGGKLVFPEIWSDSSFSRSYNCKFKFIAPDPSNLSVYLNVLVPLLHLIALVAPQMPDGNPNGYINPFLIRAIYKGFFNVDMGIITDMSVTKGAECQWTPEGVPTSIEVDIGIKDLYNAMSITQTDSTEFKFDTLNNTALMDYIANLCGINIYKPEITRIIDMWYTNNFSNRISDFFEVNIWGGIQQRVQNMIMNIYR